MMFLFVQRNRKNDRKNGFAVSKMLLIGFLLSLLLLLSPLPHGGMAQVLRERGAEWTSIYFSDSTESPGSVYEYRQGTRSKTAIFTRASDRLYSFAFAPWDPDRLYFVNANDKKIFAVSLGRRLLTEDVIFTHTTYVRDIAFDTHNNLYFSESSGAGADGKIWRIEPNGTATLFFNVKLSNVDGFWAGTFTFSPDNVLFLSSGNRIPSSVYRVDMVAKTVTRLGLLDSPSEAIVGITFGPSGRLYYANNKTRIYMVYPEGAPGKKVAYEDSRQQLWDVGFRESAPGITIPGTWVMPYPVRAIRFNEINSDGLYKKYKDGASGITMKNAPFGGGLWFRLHSSNDIPTTKIYYYRYQYRLKGTAGWNEFDSNISVHYVKNRPGKTPIFPLYKLGPHEVKGMKLYRFRPHQSELKGLVPVAPGESVEWPKIPFPADVYRAYLDTVAEGLAPGKYEMRVDIYNSSGVHTSPGLTFQMIADIGTDSLGGIKTAPASIVGGGVQYVIHIDNRKCSADISPPAIGTSVMDTCGFLRYNTAAPGLVHIAWKAWHPGGFGVYSFNIIKGASGIGKLPLPPVPGDPTPSIKLPILDEVSSTANNGDGSGNFFQDSPTLRLLGGCKEAAYAIDLYVYAKATNGNGYRITSYDAKKIIAFALAPR
jgi:hypothetical protein